MTGAFAFDPFKDQCCVIRIPTDVGFSHKDQIMFGKARLGVVGMMMILGFWCTVLK